MPQDDVRPCPPQCGTGEMRGETLADKIERARHVTMTPAMQEEQRQSWARSAMQDEEHGAFTPQPPPAAPKTPKILAWLDSLPEADRERLADMPPIGVVPEDGEQEVTT